MAHAYIDGLSAFVENGGDATKVASVASFFVSRIDTAIDKEIDRRVEAGDSEAEALKALRGKVAIANAKLAYEWYLGFIASDRWQALAAKGAMPQRLLWASTGTKDPAYPDTLYIDSLIGPDTVSTMPVKTMDAFRDHGIVEETLTRNIDEARHILGEVERLGLDLGDVTDRLVTEGVAAFARSFDTLIAAIAQKHPATA